MRTAASILHADERRRLDGGPRHSAPSGRGNYAGYVGRVGALAVALGIGAAVASTPGIAWADDNPPAQDDNGGGQGQDGGAPPAGSPTTTKDPDLGEVIRHSLQHSADNIRKIVTGVVTSSGGAHTSTHGTSQESANGNGNGNGNGNVDADSGSTSEPPSGADQQSAEQQRVSPNNQQPNPDTIKPAPHIPQFPQAISRVMTHTLHAAENAGPAPHVDTQQLRAAPTPTVHTADGQNSARISIDATDVVTLQVTAPQRSPVIRIVSGFLAAIGVGPAATGSPATPISPAFLLGGLELIRRELEQLFVNSRPDCPALSA